MRASGPLHIVYTRTQVMQCGSDLHPWLFTLLHKSRLLVVTFMFAKALLMKSDFLRCNIIVMHRFAMNKNQLVT